MENNQDTPTFLSLFTGANLRPTILAKDAVAVGVFGVRPSESQETVRTALVESHMTQRFDEYGLPSAPEITPRLAVVHMGPVGDGNMGVQFVRLFTPSGEEYAEWDHAALLAHRTEHADDDGTRFRDEQTALMKIAFGVDDAFSPVNNFLAEAINSGKALLIQLGMADTIGMLQVNDDGTIQLDPDGTPAYRPIEQSFDIFKKKMGLPEDLQLDPDMIELADKAVAERMDMSEAFNEVEEQGMARVEAEDWDAAKGEDYAREQTKDGAERSTDTR